MKSLKIVNSFWYTLAFGNDVFDSIAGWFCQPGRSKIEQFARCRLHHQ